MSFTKTLVPKSPSGINILGECDIFYPLQTMISDFYPTKPPHPPPPPPPPPSPDQQQQDEEEDIKQEVLPANVGPLPPNEPDPNEPSPVPLSISRPPLPVNTGERLMF